MLFQAMVIFLPIAMFFKILSERGKVHWLTNLLDDINRASILDLLLCNFPDDVSGLNITQDILYSDHLGISFRILTKVCRLRQVKRVIYDFKNTNFDGMREALRDIS